MYIVRLSIKSQDWYMYALELHHSLLHSFIWYFSLHLYLVAYYFHFSIIHWSIQENIFIHFFVKLAM